MGADKTDCQRLEIRTTEAGRDLQPETRHLTPNTPKFQYPSIPDYMYRPKQSVSRILFPNRVTPVQATIIHLRIPIARNLLRPTRELGRATLKHSPIWSCTGWGLHSFPGRPKNWCALTTPFHPYLGRVAASGGGILSVALSFTLPRLHVMEHPALRCSDFPPDGSYRPAIVWTASTDNCVLCLIQCEKYL